MITRKLIVAGCLVLSAVSAYAVDGVLEINQTCAKNTGCFPGDGPGFPVTITTPGSYILTGNLDLTSENPDSDAIDVNVSDVTIDLNGFWIQGPCVGPQPCSPTGLGDGVDAQPVARVEVRNGRIQNMGDQGVSLGSWGVVDDIVVTGNADNGIQTGEYAIVRSCTADDNGVDGFSVTTSSQVHDCSASRNVDRGFRSRGNLAQFVNCMANENEIGLSGFDGMTFEGNSARNNGNHGIWSGTDSLIRDNVCVGNGGTGILTGVRSLGLGNVANRNNIGIDAGSNSPLGHNVAKNNSADNIVAGFDAIACNYDGPTRVCP